MRKNEGQAEWIQRILFDNILTKKKKDDIIMSSVKECEQRKRECDIYLRRNGSEKKQDGRRSGNKLRIRERKTDP